MSKVVVEGADEIINMFRRLEHDLRPSELKALVLRPAAREVIKASRPFVQYAGEIGRYAKRDIGMVRPRGGDRNAIYVGMKFKLYDINDQVQPVAPIIQHKTQGFKQNIRKTDSGRRTGKERIRTSNDFIERGFQSSQAQQMAAINKAIDKKIAKYK